MRFEASTAFTCADPAIQRVYDEAVRKSRLNLKDFHGDRVLVEGGGYDKIWLETQPMGGEMFALHDPEAAVNTSVRTAVCPAPYSAWRTGSRPSSTSSRATASRPTR